MALREKVAANFTHGRKSGIGTTAIQLTSNSIPVYFGVLVKAANDNTGTVYVGDLNISADTDDTTSGFELGPGESVVVKIDNTNKIYLIASAASQKVFWIEI